MIVYCKSLFYYGIGKLLFWVGTTIGGKINLSALKASINCFDKSLELKKKRSNRYVEEMKRGFNG